MPELAGMAPSRVVQNTPELRRVLALPRREWTPEDAAALANQLTALLRTPNGTMQLRPIQAIALAEIGMHRGALIPVRVGGGKTLCSLLAPHVLNAARPLLVLPAKLIEKTKRARAELAKHWCIPNFLRIESYELLGRVQAAEMLERYAPDVIVLDEAHRAKSPRAAVTRRLMRYLEGHPDCRLVAMSGTITRRSLRDYAHLLRRALGDTAAPIPRGYRETEEWAAALDETKSERTTGPGALRQLAGGSDELEAVRQGFRRRLVSTPGVIATDDRFEGASLSISALRPSVGPAITAALVRLRAAWVLPDGSPLADGLAVWRHAREIAIGFYYVWDPAPPRAWLDARREWCSTCRRILSNNRRDLDSELQVARAVSDGLYPDAVASFGAWRAVRDTYKPNTVPVWIDDSVVNAAAEWAREGPGIVWCEHRAFAARLSERTGLPYYGPQGRDVRTGREIPEHPDPACGQGAIIASIKSNSEGRNLQSWSRNLIVSLPPGGLECEQLLGRTHRECQEADEVSADVIMTCQEHEDAFQQAKRDAEYIEAITGGAQKLNYADITL